MKFLPLILVLLTGCVTREVSPMPRVQSAPDAMPPKPPGLTLSWEYPSGEDILGFHLYSATKLQPLPWPLVATIPPELREWKISAGDAYRFFALTAFSEAGESEFAGTQ